VASDLDAPLAGAWLRAMAEAVAARRDELTALDAAIGDSDHGTNLDRGFTAVRALLDSDSPGPPTTPGGLITKAGATLISTVGGASGPLYGTALRRVGRSLGDAPSADPAALGAALRAGLEGIRSLGGAEPGDKTMVDAWTPAVEAFTKATADGATLADCARAAATAARDGADATTPLRARKGRASYVGDRAIGHQDPGAVSSALLFEALAEVLAD
jgi:dihydroxyacetone kinase-like protein